MLNMKIFVFVLLVIPVLSSYLDRPKRHLSTTIQGRSNPYEFYLGQEDPVSIENTDDAQSFVINIILAAKEDDAISTGNMDDIELQITDAEKSVVNVDLELREGKLTDITRGAILRGMVEFQKEGNKRLMTVPTQYSSLKVIYDQFHFQTTPSDISDLYKDCNYFEGSLVVNSTIWIAYDEITGKLSLEDVKTENTKVASYGFSKESSPNPYIHIKSYKGLYDPNISHLLDEEIQAIVADILQKKTEDVVQKSSKVLQALKMRRENLF